MHLCGINLVDGSFRGNIRMILDVLCPKCGAMVKAIAPRFEMPTHGLATVNCVGVGKPGTPINLIHVSVAPPRVLVGS